MPHLGFSDHNIVSFEIDDNYSSCLLPVPNFLAVDYSALNDFLANINWLALLDNYNSCLDVYLPFCNVIYYALGKFVPVETPGAVAPKFPAHLRAVTLQKERLFYNLSDPLNNALYKKVCFGIDHQMKKFQANRERRLAANTFAKELYLHLKHKMKPKVYLPALVDHLGNVVVSDMDKANAFAANFSNVFATAHSIFPSI
ncbi:hypothetical protein Y032_0373g190 [Ancylostoma ceylanicum]|uniref:Uncharacterized protein n=1 Tax=Ancylostoma ceylanicum TaxID=53326 RepID=A0A016RU55_9BILA|nr:hypothetical protein Y032_0373g190 [Ancylostoma ceylanicum]